MKENCKQVVNKLQKNVNKLLKIVNKLLKIVNNSKQSTIWPFKIVDNRCCKHCMLMYAILGIIEQRTPGNWGQIHRQEEAC